MKRRHRAARQNGLPGASVGVLPRTKTPDVNLEVSGKLPDGVTRQQQVFLQLKGLMSTGQSAFRNLLTWRYQCGRLHSNHGLTHGEQHR